MVFSESWFWTMMQFFVVVATLGMIYLQVRTQTASHVVSTINAITTRWDSVAITRARYFYCQKWLEGHCEFDSTAEIIAERLEEIGIIVRLRAVPRKVIWETHSWYIEHYFQMFRPGIEEVRRRHNDNALYSESEWLYEEIMKINKRRRLLSGARRPDELNIFAESEFEAARVALFLKEDGVIGRTADKAMPTSA